MLFMLQAARRYATRKPLCCCVAKLVCLRDPVATHTSIAMTSVRARMVSRPTHVFDTRVYMSAAPG